jgi:citrate synthase
LYSQAKIFNYDPGYSITGSCNSTISYATSDGKLYYRGYPIEELVEKCSYTAVCFILLYGKQPSDDELDEFENRIKDEMYVHQKILDFYKGFSHDAHPMSIMCSVVAALSSFIHGGLDIKDNIQRELSAIKLIAKMPVLAAISFRTSTGLPIV